MTIVKFIIGSYSTKRYEILRNRPIETTIFHEYKF